MNKRQLQDWMRTYKDTSKSIYGVCFKSTGAYVDTSASLQGAKNHATRHGYTEVYRRDCCGYHIELVATKFNGRWI